MDWAQILVIILAVLFIVFLVIAIALLVLILRVTMQIKAMASGAERTLGMLSGSVGALGKTALPLMVAKSIFRHIVKRSGKKGA